MAVSLREIFLSQLAQHGHVQVSEDIVMEMDAVADRAAKQESDPNAVLTYNDVNCFLAAQNQVGREIAGRGREG